MIIVGDENRPLARQNRIAIDDENPETKTTVAIHDVETVIGALTKTALEDTPPAVHPAGAATEEMTNIADGNTENGHMIQKKKTVGDAGAIRLDDTVIEMDTMMDTNPHEDAPTHPGLALLPGAREARHHELYNGPKDLFHLRMTHSTRRCRGQEEEKHPHLPLKNKSPIMVIRGV